MKVMLICMAGFTTNVLANKLQLYSTENGYGDTFIACRISNAMEFLKGNDCILIAPQARSCCNEVREEAGRLGIAQIDISEEDMAFSRIEKIYEQINVCRVEADKGMQRRFLTLSILRDVLQNTAICCVPILLLACVSWLIWLCSGSEPAGCLWTVCGRVFGFYLVFALGYQYGVSMGRDSLVSGLITLVSVLILIPVSDLESQWLGSFYVVEGTISLSFVSFPYSVLLLIPAVLSMVCQEAFHRLPLGKLPQTSGGTYGLSMAYIVRGGCVFLVFTAFRTLLWAVVSAF